MDNPDDTICLPIKNLEELYCYVAPNWASRLSSLEEINWCKVAEPDRCHVKLNEWTSQSRFFRHSVPRTLVCHDMQGGYLDDRFVNGSKSQSAYNFYHWNLIDIFVYFSHHFVTLPPYGWINAAHKHGVSILGTIIVENDDGALLLDKILESEKSIRKFVDGITQVTRYLKLDGWLLNIEVKTDKVENLKLLVRLLNSSIHEVNPRNLIIWYDSVIESGELKWQNEVNAKNRCWFDLCDGIFLNYNWNESMLQKTKLECRTRNLDVFVGIDVFGRNCIGEMDSWKAMEMIRKFDLSAAIFAPGWTFETLEIEPQSTFQNRYQIRDQQFWKSLGPYLYEHGCSKLFTTSFNAGFCNGHYNLGKQDLPINSLILGCSNKLKLSPVLEALTNTCDCIVLSNNCINPNGTSLKISNLNLEGKSIHRLVGCDISTEEVILIALIVDNTKVDLAILFREVNGRTDILLPKETEMNTDDKNWILNKGFDCIDLKSPWNFKCFKVERKIRILEIGIMLTQKKEVRIGGISIQKYPLKHACD